jgi:putative phosphoesterase
MFTLGILADTHIPDRALSLHPQIIPIFRQARVRAILHAGDISSPAVLEELRQAAPVYAVRGNRDWFMLRKLPEVLFLEFCNIPIVLTHGHGNLHEYLVDKYRYMKEGYRLERYQPRLRAAFPEARVIVFGHTHFAVNEWADGQLLFNPGSPHFPGDVKKAPSLGLLHFEDGGKVTSELAPLERFTVSSDRGT